jgi:hypothetical protein
MSDIDAALEVRFRHILENEGWIPKPTASISSDLSTSPEVIKGGAKSSFQLPEFLKLYGMYIFGLIILGCIIGITSICWNMKKNKPRSLHTKKKKKPKQQHVDLT